MTEATEYTYVAQVILALPGQSEPATVTVTLVPTDHIPVGGRTKLLADCTLAELRAFTNTLEGDVWKAYDAITLHELQDDAAAAIEIKILDGRDASPEAEDWLKHVVVFNDPPANQNDETGEEPSTKLEEPPAKERQHTKPKPSAKAEPVLTTDAEIVPTQPLEQQAVESKPAVEPKASVQSTAPPAIVPSLARVRVAGGHIPLAQAGNAAVDILMDEAPLRAMQAHALSSLDREVAGVMIGQLPEKQPDGRYVVHIIDSIAAKYTVMQGASVTYTPETWRYLNDTLWERYPDETGVMVGWYHTHPGFGIFLSGMDLFIHQNFFTQIWHIAYVLDPRARTSGFFCWNRTKTKVNRYNFIWPDWAGGSW